MTNTTETPMRERIARALKELSISRATKRSFSEGDRKMSEPKAKEIIVNELISGGHTLSSAEYLVNSLAYFARDEALEEAARVAENFDDEIRGDEIVPPSQFDIAAAIRELKEKQG